MVTIGSHRTPYPPRGRCVELGSDRIGRIAENGREDRTAGIDILIDRNKEGAAYRSMLNGFARLTSIALKYGVQLEILVDQFVFTLFELQGPVKGHDRGWLATSVSDFGFRALAGEYLVGDDLAHIPREEGEATPVTATSDVPALRAQAISTTNEI